jgi:Tfp pilus assembly protein PilN
MRFNDETGAGIDISQDRINIVLLKNGKNGPQLVKSASVSMPQGAVKDGNIADAVLLAKTIKNLKFRNRIWTKRAAVSLFARPVVVQIIDMPQQVPSNIRQFVNSEVKNCVVLPSRDIALDFCGVGSAKRAAGSTLRQNSVQASSPQADKRVLAVAAESARMVELVRVCSKAGFSVELIEPPLLGYLRAVNSQKVAGKSGCNVLVAMLRTDVLTLCVLRNGAIDFIRTRDSGQRSADSVHRDLSHWLADELSEVVRFCDTDVPENTGKWNVTVFLDTEPPRLPVGGQERGPQLVEECIKSRMQTSSVRVRTIEDAYMDTPLGGSAGGTNEKPSPVAVGLAMHLLMQERDYVKINLLPPQIAKTRETKMDALIAVNVVAAVLLIMVLAVGWLTATFGSVNRDAAVKKPLVTRRRTEVMVEQHRHLDARLKALSGRLASIEEIRSLHRDVNWAELFEDVRRATPGAVRITGLVCQDGSRMLVSGLAMSNEAVNLFVSLLEKSHSIESVALLETREQEGQGGLITYQISCKPAI